MPTIKLADGGSLRITEDRMRDLASYLKRLLDQGIAEREQYSTSWQQSRNDYENVAYPYISKMVTGATDLPFPFAFTRAEALSDHTVTSLVTQSPMVTCLMWDAVGDGVDQDALQEQRQRTMDEVLRRAKIEERLKTIAPACWWANTGILRVSAGDVESPIRIDAICPEDFVIVGSGAYGIKDSLMVGHRFQRSRGDVKRLQSIGRYAKEIDADVLPAAVGDKDVPASAGATDAELVDLWQLYPYMDPSAWDMVGDQPEVTTKERRFVVVMDPETESILTIEEHALRTPCYFAFGYKPAPDRGFWHPRPLGADMQGPHRAYQCLSNLALYGTAMSAIPPMVAQSGAFSRNQQYGPGQFVSMEAGDVMVPTVTVRLDQLQAELARVERVGDGVARINAAGAGVESMQRKTATQSDNEMAGMMAGIGGFLETFSGPLADMCEHTEEILEATFKGWKPVYKSQMPVDDPAVFAMPAKWDIPGKIPNLNPQAMIANLQTLMGIVGQVFQFAQAGGPAVFEWGINLLKIAMNAMDFPNAESMMQPLEAMIAQTEQQPVGPEADPGLGAPDAGDPDLQALLQSALGADQGQAVPMPEALAY